MRSKWVRYFILSFFLLFSFLHDPIFSFSNIQQDSLEDVLKRSSQNFFLKITRESPMTLFLQNPVGSIEIKGEDREDIEVEASVSIWAQSQDMAFEYLKEMVLQGEMREDLLEISLEGEDAQDFEISHKEIHYQLVVPRDLPLILSCSSGRVLIKKMESPVQLKGYFNEEIIIEEIRGDLNLQVQYGDVSITHMEGNLTAELEHSQGFFQEIKGDFILDSRHSSIILDNIYASSTLQSNHDQIQGKDVATLFLFSNHSQIILESLLGPLYGKIFHGSLALEQIAIPLEIYASFGDVKLELEEIEEGYTFYLSAFHGQIRSSFSLFQEQEKGFLVMEGEYGPGKHVIQIELEHGFLHLGGL